jgi:hypothetical protein
MGANSPDPAIQARATQYAPTYQTTNADGNIGGAGAVLAGAWTVEGRVLRLELAFTFGAAPAPGTGTILVPWPPGFSADDIDPNGLASLAAFDLQGRAQAIKTLAGVTTLQACWLQLATFGVNVAGFANLLAGLAGAIAGDSFRVSVDIPIKEPAVP